MRCRRDPASKPFEPAREHTWRPPAEGLYDLSLEKDSCGVGFIANIKGKKSHQTRSMRDHHSLTISNTRRGRARIRLALQVRFVRRLLRA